MNLTLENLVKFGDFISQFLSSRDIICLEGDLGAGKTTLARSIIKGFIQNQQLTVPSPSYLLHLEYKSKRGLIHHIDPYRLPDGRIARLLPLEEYFENDISIIEHPTKLGDIIPSLDPPRLEITISGSGPQAGNRTLTINPIGEKWESIFATFSFETIIKHGIISGEEIHEISQLTSEVGTSSSETDENHYFLGIESSCDDTCAAVVRGDGKILSDEVISQKIHEEFRGVNPQIAAEEHAKNIDIAVQNAMENANISFEELTAVVVTMGPGLSMCLRVGLEKAMRISYDYQKPIIKTHHMESHMMVSMLPDQNTLSDSKITYPFVTVLISGGHSMFVLSRGLGDHIIIGETLDDSIGEVFDKVARSLGIVEVPGGPILEKYAEMGSPKYKFTQPLKNTNHTHIREGSDMSFSGLKSQVKRTIDKELSESSEEELENKRYDIASSFQNTATTHLTWRLRNALNKCQELEPSIKDIIVAGGVACNKFIRSEIEKVVSKYNLELHIPHPKLCRDNGVMVAWTGIERFKNGLLESPIDNLEVELANIELRSRWNLGRPL